MQTQMEEQIYTESELLQVLYGLDTVYYNKPWFTRWLFKPWHDALMTATSVLCGNKLAREFDNANIIRSIEDSLGENS